MDLFVDNDNAKINIFQNKIMKRLFRNGMGDGGVPYSKNNRHKIKNGDP